MKQEEEHWPDQVEHHGLDAGLPQVLRAALSVIIQQVLHDGDGLLHELGVGVIDWNLNTETNPSGIHKNHRPQNHRRSSDPFSAADTLSHVSTLGNWKKILSSSSSQVLNKLKKPPKPLVTTSALSFRSPTASQATQHTAE